MVYIRETFSFFFYNSLSVNRVELIKQLGGPGDLGSF